MVVGQFRHTANCKQATWRTHSCVQRSHSCERLELAEGCSQECEHGTQGCVRYILKLTHHRLTALKERDRLFQPNHGALIDARDFTRQLAVVERSRDLAHFAQERKYGDRVWPVRREGNLHISRWNLLRDFLGFQS